MAIGHIKTTSNGVKYYELTYLAPDELSGEELKNLQEKIISHIQENDGILKESRAPIRQKLALAIKKWSDAFSVVLDFHSAPEKIADIEKKLKSESRILRFMILIKKLPGSKSKAPRLRGEVRLSEAARRVPKSPGLGLEIPKISEKPLIKKEKKVELKEIEKKLEEILRG